MLKKISKLFKSLRLSKKFWLNPFFVLAFVIAGAILMPEFFSNNEEEVEFEYEL